MTRQLTKRQESILAFITRYVNQHGYPPSIREIGPAFGIKSLRGVTIHLDALERKGYIRRESTSRSIQVLASDAGKVDSYVRLPILGAIAAGAPLLAEQNIEGEMAVPGAMLRGITDAFLLRVRGDSMVDTHILDGDIVVIRPQQTAENGEIVAALLGDEATVKRFRIEGEESALTPANRAYEPIPLRGKDIRLIGKVIGLLRTY